MKIEMESTDGLLLIALLATSHLSIYNSKTIIISKRYKKIYYEIKQLRDYMKLFENYKKRDSIKFSIITEKNVITLRNDTYKHTWWLKIIETINWENLAGICGDYIMIILDNVKEKGIKEVALANCNEAHSHCIILED